MLYPNFKRSREELGYNITRNRAYSINYSIYFLYNNLTLSIDLKLISYIITLVEKYTLGKGD